VHIVREWLSRLFGREPTDKRGLELEQEVQRLRLELAEQEQAVARLKQELERQRGSASAHVAEAVQVQVEQLLADVATPVAQLLTQVHLLEVEGQPVQAKDVLALVKRLVRTLEDNSLMLEGRVGESVPFDPDRHEPLSADVSPKAGQMVTVRFVGVAYRGKLLHKAGVEQSSNEQ
jgi:molecular chaperone GrpE (heat shock protein)